MSLQQFKVLTFDVVGTLIDFEGGMLAYLRTLVPASRVGDDDFLVAYRDARKSADSTWYPDDLERVWHAIAPALGLPDSPQTARGFRDSVSGWPAFPDSVEALKRLGRRYKLVTMTNAQRWALTHFEKTLGNPFDMPLSCDDALCEKPDPKYFAYARGRYEGEWGFKQADNLHVAQSQYHDIGIARKLGYKVCWIERRQGIAGFGGTPAVETLTKPDFHFPTLKALADAAIGPAA